mgnify:CR=1 FL=1
MTLLETIKNDMITAMKEKDSFRLGVIRMAKGAIQLEEINKKIKKAKKEHNFQIFVANYYLHQ